MEVVQLIAKMRSRKGHHHRGSVKIGPSNGQGPAQSIAKAAGSAGKGHCVGKVRVAGKARSAGNNAGSVGKAGSTAAASCEGSMSVEPPPPGPPGPPGPLGGEFFTLPADIVSLDPAITLLDLSCCSLTGGCVGRVVLTSDA